MKKELKTKSDLGNMQLFMGVTDEEITKLFKLEDDIKVSMVYEELIGRKTINIGFTNDKRAFWISKYKGKYYGNMTEPYDMGKDYFLNIDIYLTMRQNAKDTLKELKHTK